MEDARAIIRKERQSYGTPNGVRFKFVRDHPMDAFAGHPTHSKLSDPAKMRQFGNMTLAKLVEELQESHTEPDATKRDKFRLQCVERLKDYADKSRTIKERRHKIFRPRRLRRRIEPEAGCDPEPYQNRNRGGTRFTKIIHALLRNLFPRSADSL
jgi:hypothetical protein